MNPQSASQRKTLARDVLLLQVKLLLDALRDIALSPVTLGAAAIDFVLAGRQPPRFLHAGLRLGQRSDDWIDLSAAFRGACSTDPHNVDSLLASVERVVTDPKSGTRRARLLKRWVERELSRAPRRVGVEALPDSPTC
ncbi:MAG: hypothetical protein ABI650_04700 [Dokdonella sp.]